MIIEFITITASDAHSSESTSKSFFILSKDFKSEVEEWESELPYRRYELHTDEFVGDLPNDIQVALEELEVSV